MRSQLPAAGEAVHVVINNRTDTTRSKNLTAANLGRAIPIFLRALSSAMANRHYVGITVAREGRTLFSMDVSAEGQHWNDLDSQIFSALLGMAEGLEANLLQLEDPQEFERQEIALREAARAKYVREPDR